MLFPSPGTTQYLSLGRLEKVISFIGEQNSKTTIHAFPLWRATIINYKSLQERSECFQVLRDTDTSKVHLLRYVSHDCAFFYQAVVLLFVE